MHIRFILAMAMTVFATLFPISSNADGSASNGLNNADVNIAMLLVLKRSCDANVPGFKEKSAAGYAQWRQSNINLIQKFEARMKEPPQGWKTNSTAQEQVKTEKLCNNEVLPKLHGFDTRFSSFDKTWNIFLGALKSADRSLAISCLTSRARDNFKPVLENMPQQGMADMANSIKSTQVTMDLGSAVEIAVTHNNGKAGSVTFQNEGGEWKISDM